MNARRAWTIDVKPSFTSYTLQTSCASSAA